MKLPHRTLGRSGLDTTSVVLGAMGFTTRTLEAETEHLLECLRGSGIGTLDTAPLYGFGRSERAIGRVLAQLPEASRPRIWTKVGLRWDDTHGDVLFVGRDLDGTERVVRRDSRPESVEWEVAQSLERLGVSVIDLVQVHQRDPHVPIAETMAALAGLVRKGHVRAIGVSNYGARDLLEARRALGSIPLASLQSPCSLLDRSADEALGVARDHEVGFLAYSPLAQGLLTGAHGPERSYADDDWRVASPLFAKGSRRRIATALATLVDPIARRLGATRTQVALAWVLARPGMTAVIAGASRPEQALENAQAATLELSPADQRSLAEGFAALIPTRGPLTRVRDQLSSVRARASRLFHKRP